MAEKTFAQWLSGQTHKRGDKITNWQRATSRFLPPNGVTTWGQWYDQAGITPDFEKPKPTKAETDTTKYLTPKITMTKVSIESLTNELYGLTPGTEEYQTTLDLLNKRKKELKDLETRFKAAKAKEDKPKITADNKKATDDYNNKLKTWEKALADAKADLQTAKDTGGDVQGAQAEVNRIKGEKPKAPTLAPLPGEKPAAEVDPDAAKAAGARSISKTDADGDGIPDVIDAQPKVFNKPPAKSDGAPQTPPKQTVTADGTVIAAGEDDKTTWVSYLKATFKSLEDPAMKKEIDALITRANKFNMTEDEFLNQLEGTKWWQTTYPSVAQFFIDSHDPRNAATFAESVKNSVEGVTRKLESLGIRINDIDPTTGKVIDNSELIKGIALKKMENGWDDNDLNDFLASRSDVLFTGGGTIGSSFESIKRQASLYGVSIDKNFEKEINLSLLDTNDLRDANYWLTEMRQQAYDNPMYKAFAPAMKDNNRTLYEVTNSYRKQMADLLEVDSTQITWKDLMDKAVDGTTGNARTFADFTKALKKDPMWQYTKNAKETYSNMALDIAKMFGFVG